jgi:peptidoglycan/LPS O-acetylase OafA/YrhL
VLVYVYPLRIVVASGLYMVTGGFVPADLQIDATNPNFELQTAFIIYGVGFGLLSLILYLLNRHALRRAEALGLDPMERLQTRGEMGIQAWLFASAVASIVLSVAMLAFGGKVPHPLLAGAPMFVYMVLGAAIPLYGYRVERARQRLLARPD